MIRSTSWFCLILAICLNAGASILLKLSTERYGLTQLFTAGGSVACYVLAFLAYAVCLRDFPVSVAYPVITGGAIVTIVATAALLLGEHLTASRMLGAGLIVAGGILLLGSSRSH